MVKSAKSPGFLPDGGGLYLQVINSNSKSWIFRFQRNGKRHDMGLGSAQTVTLANARLAAAEQRALLDAGIDPIENRRNQEADRAKQVAQKRTFMDCAYEYIESHKPAWRNTKHAAQWKSTLEKFVKPVFDEVAISAVDVELVMRALSPHWSSKPETMVRVRGRIENIIDWAKALGFRTGENPARWRGHLENLLPKPSKIRRVVHFRSLPHQDLPDFVATLSDRSGISALALQFTILTAARTSEATGARWSEINSDAKYWTIPENRIKMEREHVVPLTTNSWKILEEMKNLRPTNSTDGYIFPGQRRGKPLSNMAMLTLLKRMERSDITVHGFRSTFRNWVAERTDYPREIAEKALAHAVNDKVEAAYLRTDYFEKRRNLMNDWDHFCFSKIKKLTVPQ